MKTWFLKIYGYFSEMYSQITLFFLHLYLHSSLLIRVILFIWTMVFFYFSFLKTFCAFLIAYLIKKSDKKYHAYIPLIISPITFLSYFAVYPENITSPFYFITAISCSFAPFIFANWLDFDILYVKFFPKISITLLEERITLLTNFMKKNATQNLSLSTISKNLDTLLLENKNVRSPAIKIYNFRSITAKLEEMLFSDSALITENRKTRIKTMISDLDAQIKFLEHCADIKEKESDIFNILIKISISLLIIELGRRGINLAGNHFDFELNHVVSVLGGSTLSGIVLQTDFIENYYKRVKTLSIPPNPQASTVNQSSVVTTNNVGPKPFDFRSLYNKETVRVHSPFLVKNRAVFVETAVNFSTQTPLSSRFGYIFPYHSLEFDPVEYGYREDPVTLFYQKNPNIQTLMQNYPNVEQLVRAYPQFSHLPVQFNNYNELAMKFYEEE